MSIDKIRAYWNQRPCNIRHSPVDIDRDPLTYSRQVSRRKLFVEPHIWTHAEPPLWAGAYVLDLGCGIGTQAILFAKAGAEVLAVDLSQKSLEIARKRVFAEGLENHITLLCEDIEQPWAWLPLYAQRDFDLVYSFGVLHHTPHARWALYGLQSWMTKESELRIMVYNRFSWKALWIMLTYGKGRFWRWAKLIAEHSEAQTGCPYTQTYTPGSIRRMLAHVGYEAVSVTKDHIFPYQIEEYKQYRYVLEPFWNKVPSWLFRWLEHRFGWHLLVQAKPKEYQC